MPESIKYYSSYQDHLLDELRWLNKLIAVQVLELRTVHFHSQIKDFRSFLISDDEVDHLLVAGVFEAGDQSDDERRNKLIQELHEKAQKLRLEIDQRVQESLLKNISLPLVQLTRLFHLSALEIQAMVICLAPQIDARYEKLYAYLQNDITKKAPSIELILGLIGQSIEERIQYLPYFDASGSLRQFRLIESLETGSGLSAGQQFFRADPRILQYVLGNHALDSRILLPVQFLPSVSWDRVVISADLKARLERILQLVLDNSAIRRNAIHLYGRAGVGKKTAARALCHDMGLALLTLDLRNVAPTTNFRESIRLILREGLLQPCAVYFDHLEFWFQDSSDHKIHLTELARQFDQMGWLMFLGSEKPLPVEWFDDLSVYSVEIPAPEFVAQKQLWRLNLEGFLTDKDTAIADELVSHFDLTGGQISRSVQMAANNPENGQITPSDLLAASRLQSQPGLGRLAQKIEPVYTWQDIILPEDTLAQLQEICQRVRHRHRVLGEWGFNRKLSSGKGVNALFAGPSGTGKTMAAEIIANELKLDIYKIDLSGVVSKYIGETEKNLDQIFTAAEHANAILFFDEADALFGKRSEVRDSHDRYANIEISYLLQKMEQYEGIAILATNLRQNLDESFVRRLAFTVHFPFPDETDRQRIWAGIWPCQTPLTDEVDLDFLARQFKLSGGNIKNVALAAAFLASADGGRVTMNHLFHATQREYQKLGKVLSNAELYGSYKEMKP